MHQAQRPQPGADVDVLAHGLFIPLKIFNVLLVQISNYPGQTRFRPWFAYFLDHGSVRFPLRRSPRHDQCHTAFEATPNNLEAFWMPFTANRQFKAKPRLFVGAKDMHYTTVDGRKVLDGTAGLWCVNAGHGREKITEAVRDQVGRMDYAPAFQMGHPAVLRIRRRGSPTCWARISTMSSSPIPARNRSIPPSRSPSPIIARKGEGTRQRLIGRERGYHGVGLRRHLGRRHRRQPQGLRQSADGVDHLPHTHDLAKNAFSRGQPEHGAELADELERIVTLHDASNIAAVIVEPVACSTGVLLPPKGYLQRLREICTKHGILLIFDEVITGFGRLGASFATEYFGVVAGSDHHGQGHHQRHRSPWARSSRARASTTPSWTRRTTPSSCSTAIPIPAIRSPARPALRPSTSTGRRAVRARRASLAPYWEDGVHSLKGTRNVIDLRNLGLLAGIELEPRPGKPTARAFDAFLKCYDKNLLIRTTGDIIALSPPLIVEKKHIDQIFDTLGDVLATVD